MRLKRGLSICYTCVERRLNLRSVIGLERTVKLDNKKLFLKSLHPHELRTTTTECSFAPHCRGVIREVITYLELRAEPDRDRFVWFEIDHLVSQCFHFPKKDGKRFSVRQVKYALKYLRRHNVISERLTRARGGVERTGVIVATHASLFRREGRLCSFVGRLKPGTVGTWQRDPDTRSWFWVRKGLRERTWKA